MSYIEIYDLIDSNNKTILTVKGQACFSSLFSMSHHLLMGDNTLNIYHLLDYGPTNRQGVKDYFDKADRAFYLDKIKEITGVEFIETQGTISWHCDAPVVACHILTTKIKDSTTYVQLKAAVTATRYLIEDPFSDFLKQSIRQYKKDPLQDFFKIFQNCHYKATCDYISDHTWFPKNIFWGFISTEHFNQAIKTVVLSSFGEPIKAHQSIFVKRSVSLQSLEIPTYDPLTRRILSYKTILTIPNFNI